MRVLITAGCGFLWVYRVAIAVNRLNDPPYGDAYLFSRPLSVIVP